MAGLTSTIPAALDALMAACNVIAADPDVSLTVYDGQIGMDAADNAIVVGSETKGWQSETAGLGNLRRHEEYTIVCDLLAHSGSGGDYAAPVVRALAFGLIERFVEQLTANPTLGGAVRFAEMVGADGGITRQGVSSIGGWSVEIQFGVRCQATLTI